MEAHSIAETRSQLSQLIKRAEAEAVAVPVTRRGKIVAYIVPADEFGRLTKGPNDFFSSLVAFRERSRGLLLGDDEDIFADARGDEHGRPVEL